MIQQEPRECTITYHTVTLGQLTREGVAQAEIILPNEDGEPQTLTVLVPAGLPGEQVTIAYEPPPTPPKRRRRHWKPRPARTWITEMHTTSPLRVEAACPVFGTCGGCQLQHMHYESQLEWKRAVVEQLLQDVGNFDDPPLLATVPCDIPWNYRNQMRFSVNRDGQLGLTARGTRRVLPLNACPIAHQRINDALGILGCSAHPRPQVVVRYGAASGQMLIQPQQTPEMAQTLAEAELDIHTETMEEVLAGETFRIRPSSFFQTNTAQANKMLDMVLAGLLSSNERAASELRVVDAYCGVGTFALFLARHVAHVIAIEESPSAITDAEWNLRHVDNVAIRKGKVEDLLPEMAATLDGLVIDPPRAGCQRGVLDALAANPVQRIVYVSCDPSTLARDLDILCHQHATYRLRTIQPLDMFPHTAHIETITVLEHVC